jgi:hypothetical protein
LLTIFKDFQNPFYCFRANLFWARSRVWIKALAFGAGDRGFKSPRARYHFLVLPVVFPSFSLKAGNLQLWFLSKDAIGSDVEFLMCQEIRLRVCAQAIKLEWKSNKW